jgi:AraC family transcriptional regulator of adaptative response/methylated-DNA-[protein]-cysteine methyltransferase
MPEIVFDVEKCYLGWFLVARSDLGIHALSLGDTEEALIAELKDLYPAARIASLDRTVEEVAETIEDPRVELITPLVLDGSEFQKAVWVALRQIPAGTTVSYGRLAAAVGVPRAHRAVAAACAANRIAVAVPCHRVIRSDGSLSGYRWGAERKRLLLERERCPAAATPTKK